MLLWGQRDASARQARATVKSEAMSVPVREVKRNSRLKPVCRILFACACQVVACVGSADRCQVRAFIAGCDAGRPCEIAIRAAAVSVALTNTRL
jgi:hypothetical protein